MNLVIQVEKTGELMNAKLINSIIKMYKEIHAPISPKEVDFKESLCTKETILITLRINEQEVTGEYFRPGYAQAVCHTGIVRCA